MNPEIRKLFERYCYSKGLTPKTGDEVDVLQREFFGSLSNDLMRAFYLDQLNRISIQLPDLTQGIHGLLTQLPSVQDPRLQSLREQKVQLDKALSQTLEADRLLYQLSQNDFIRNVQDQPNVEGLVKLAQKFDPAYWHSQINQLEANARVFDQFYHKNLKEFLDEMDDIRKKLKGPTIKKSELKAPLQKVLPVVYRLGRRGEMGLELIELVSKGRLSFLCYAELVTKSEDEFEQYMKEALVISQLDLLYDRDLMSQELFFGVRKKSILEIRYEVHQRMRMLEIMDRLLQNRWIDPKQIEVVLQNSITQSAGKLLDTLEVYVIKKEVGRLIAFKTKDIADASEIQSQWSSLMKSNALLQAFYKDLLGDEADLDYRIASISVDLIRELLRKHLPQATSTAQPPPAPQTKAANPQPTPSKATNPQPAPSAAASPPVSPPASPPQSKITELSPAPEASQQAPKSEMVQQLENLQQQLKQGAAIFGEILDKGLEGEEALQLLGQRQLIFPETEQSFETKFQLLLRQEQSGKGDSASMLMGKLKIEVRNGLKLDTEAFQLKEMMRTFGPEFRLLPDESPLIQGSNQSVKDRSFWVDKLKQKYILIHDLKQSSISQIKFAELDLLRRPALLVYVLQDVMRSRPFFFQPEELETFHKLIPEPHPKTVDSARRINKELYDTEIPPQLFRKLIEWGLWLVDVRIQRQLADQLADAFTVGDTIDWRGLVSGGSSLKTLQSLVNAASSDIQEVLDAKAQNLYQEFQHIVDGKDPNVAKDVPMDNVKYLGQSLAVTEYLVKIRNLYRHFINIETSLEDYPPPSDPPSGLMRTLESILEMEYCDQRLELLLDEVTDFLTMDSPLSKEGIALYRDVTGFDF